MKKAVAHILCVLLTLCCIASCADPKPERKKISIVTTIFPIYDWVKNIIGENDENIELTLLLDSGVDLHSYQPSAGDILKISTCDLFIHVGGESDSWVHAALEGAANDNVRVLNLLNALGGDAKNEETVEGMQQSEPEHEHDEHDEDSEGHEHEHEAEYDEHIWLSLKNASKLTSAILEEIVKLDGANTTVYRQNAEAYIEKLNALDAEYMNIAENAKVKTLVFCDRFPFRYLVDDYGLSYYAAFPGCSAETEASFETVAFLSDKVNELALKNVFTIEGSDQRIAKTVISNTLTKDQSILKLDSMQGTTPKDAQSGKDYLSIMEANLLELAKALV